jgi:multiple sugar transport system substrate-binding protein
MKMTNFQIIFTGVFVLLILIGVAVFASMGGVGGSAGVGSVVIWGEADQTAFDEALQTLRQQDKSFQDVQYVQKNPSTYTADLVNAMASGTGPDIFLITQESLTPFMNKIATVPYNTVSQATFTSAYIDEAQLFLTAQGSLALPLLVDPMVMYWNRDMLASAGIAQPPRYWNDLLGFAPKVTVLNGASTVRKSAVALGEWRNISHAKAILSALFMQAGDPIVGRDKETGFLTALFGTTPTNAPENPAVSALKFYTEFTNPTKTTYSWNHSLPLSRDAFISGDLALYFGFASDYATIESRNPNLHFSVAALPQIEGNSIRSTYGVMTGVAISRAAPNPMGALTIVQKLTDQTGIVAFAQGFKLPPVRRDIVPDTTASAPASVFAESALIARGWLDPDKTSTNALFQNMIESVISGKAQADQAVGEAVQVFGVLMRPYASQ